MNPDKLFDYLDGKLSAWERNDLEQRLVADPDLQRELAVARQIHKSMRDTREILARLDESRTSNRGAVLGRRIVIVFSVLVFANVAFGIYAIAFMEKKRLAQSAREQNRQEVKHAFEKEAATALPPPSLDVEEIKFSAPIAKQNELADTIVDAAKRVGGSAAKGLADEHGILLFAEIPTRRLNEFRDEMRKLGGTIPAAQVQPATGEKSILQVRILSAQ